MRECGILSCRGDPRKILHGLKAVQDDAGAEDDREAVGDHKGPGSGSANRASLHGVSSWASNGFA